MAKSVANDARIAKLVRLLQGDDLAIALVLDLVVQLALRPRRRKSPRD